MNRIDSAILLSLAFNEPRRLDRERDAALRDAAAPIDDASVLARGLAMADEIERGQVLVS